MEFGLSSDWLVFLGRLHPLVVHFPIAVLLLAALLEAISRLEPAARLAHAVPFVLALGALSAAAAATTGYLVSHEGGYDEQLLAWHMWLGFGVAAGSLVALVLKLASRNNSSRMLARAYPVLLGASVGALVLAGHYGSTIGHGPGYLTSHLPDPLRSWFAPAGARRGAFDDLDSALLFQDLVHPILERRCISCHGESRTEGNLRLDDPERILEGGKSGDTVVPGEPGGSELVRRTTLPPFHRDHMPPEGRSPLPLEEIELIRWWIERGASLEQTVGQARRDGTPPSIQTVLNRLAGPDEDRPRGIFALKVPPSDPRAVEELSRTGVRVRRISQRDAFVEVDFSGVQAPLGPEQLNRLLPIAPQVAWLNLAGCEIAPEGFALLGRLDHLTRLHLEKSNVTDADLAHLKGLEYLEYLNLYGTRVTDAALPVLSELESLKSLFLWQTEVTPGAALALQEQIRGLEVSLGAAAQGPLLPDTRPAP